MKCSLNHSFCSAGMGRCGCPLLNNTHVFSGDEVETVEQMGWPMRVLTIELEDGQQWGRRTAEKLSIPVLWPCQEHNCDLFEYVSLERLSIPVPFMSFFASFESLLICNCVHWCGDFWYHELVFAIGDLLLLFLLKKLHKWTFNLKLDVTTRTKDLFLMRGPMTNKKKKLMMHTKNIGHGWGHVAHLYSRSQTRSWDLDSCPVCFLCCKINEFLLDV